MSNFLTEFFTHRLAKSPLKARLFSPDTSGKSLIALPADQLRKMGLVYNAYRFIISLFLFLSSYAVVYENNQVTVTLPSFLHQTILLFYGIFSVLIMALFYVVKQYPRRQLAFGLMFDVVVISLILYVTGTPDIQLVMLYMVVVAASFIMLVPYQAVVITLLAIIFVIYQQFFYAVTGSMNLANLGDAVLLSFSFLSVGFLSWYVSQQLAQVEKIAQNQASEVAKLNSINQQVIANMAQGVMVFDDTLSLRLCNNSALYLLDIVKIPTDNDLEIDQLLLSDVDLTSDSKSTAFSTTDAISEPDAHLTLIHDGETDKTLLSRLQDAHPDLYAWLGQTSPYDKSILYYEAERKDASIVKLRVHSTPLFDGSRLVMLEDIRREQTQAQQLKLASLGQLTASIAHEIRNPLATISQASQLLIEDAGSKDDNDTDDNCELYAMIFAQTKRVNRIIEDVLSLSRQAKPQSVQFDMSIWIHQFIAEHFASFDVFVHTADDLDGLVVQFDTHQLEQILINLINNGLRYSSQSHPHAFVEIEIYARQNDVILDVLDTGAGVRAEHRASLFNPFFTTDTSGTGLGLYLSQAFSEANDAQLIFVPNHSKTCFRLIMSRVMA